MRGFFYSEEIASIHLPQSLGHRYEADGYHPGICLFLFQSAVQQKLRVYSAFEEYRTILIVDSSHP